jgi:hypothetical protein
MTPETAAGRDLSGHVDRFGNIAVDVTIGGGPGAWAATRATGASASPATVAGFLRELADDVERADGGAMTPETTPAVTPETPTPARRETPRGFAVYDEFADRYGNEVRVQKSSSATDDCVWVFAHPAGDSSANASPHLNVEMARRMRDALGVFISEHGGETPDAS